MGFYENTRKSLVGALEIEKGRKIYVTDGEYFICPIVEQDRAYYVELHMQINGETTLFFKSIL